MEEYEVRRMAEDAARYAADDLRRDIGYRIDELERQLDQIRRDVEDERRDRRTAISSVYEQIDR
jgi:50S ribosomal subunit-associated GTPase HflX